VIDSARHVVRSVRRLEPLVPGLLFVAFVIAFVGLAAAAGTRSPLLALACVAIGHGPPRAALDRPAEVRGVGSASVG
jgi:hypothetical protein